MGKVGEDLACKFLVEKGYSLLERNWTCYAGELDLILRKDLLVFVEVKTMSYGDVSLATEHFTPNKKRCVHRTVLMYLVKKGLLGCDWQFDLICISLNKERKLRHYENVAL